VNTELFQLALEHFARATGAGPHKRILLVLDGAGWHSSRALKVPEGIQLTFLPPYTPELQPAERLWPLIHEPIVNRPIETLDELEHIVVQRCRTLTADSERIRDHTLFDWWPSHETQ
jgi:transposase